MSEIIGEQKDQPMMINIEIGEADKGTLALGAALNYKAMKEQANQLMKDNEIDESHFTNVLAGLMTKELRPLFHQLCAIYEEGPPEEKRIILSEGEARKGKIELIPKVPKQ